jgi:hypothetical protein
MGRRMIMIPFAIERFPHFELRLHLTGYLPGDLACLVVQ